MRLAAVLAIRAYSAEQPRDERGRWTDEGTEKDLDDMLAKAPLAKNEIDTLGRAIAAKIPGASLVSAPIKSRSRALEKIRKDYDGDASRIGDLARNTIVVPQGKEEDALKALLAARPDLTEKDYFVVKADADPLGYSGVNVKLNTRAGIKGEMQINSPEMIVAKHEYGDALAALGEAKVKAIMSRPGTPDPSQGHHYYEQWRSLPPGHPDAALLEERSKRYYAAFRRAGAAIAGAWRKLWR
jgi:hypothetical protein